MQQIEVPSRPDSVQQMEGLGFSWHTMYDAPYWDESRVYKFSLAQVEDHIEDPSAELMELCYRLVDHVVETPELLHRFQIPEDYHAYVCDSWNGQERDLYGRFDFSYDGKGPAKLLEFNADTPTGLFETAVVQWQWLEDMKERGYFPDDTDQFNSVHEKLIDAFRGLGITDTLYFGGVLDLDEDAGTIAYMADCAAQAGLVSSMIDMSLIGYDIKDRFTDASDRVIHNLFKLYPWENLFREEFASKLLAKQCRIIEPAWKSLLSNKAILPLLWEMYPGHPNLLEAYFADDPRSEGLEFYARKPIFAREGANITLRTPAGTIEGKNENYGAEGYVIQELAMLPKFGDSYPVIGSWIIAGRPAGMAIREDASPITQNLSRFVPHIIT